MAKDKKKNRGLLAHVIKPEDTGWAIEDVHDHTGKKSGRAIFDPPPSNRPDKWDWERAYFRLIALALKGELCPDQKEIEYKLTDVLCRGDENPSPTVLREKAKAILAEYNCPEWADE